MRDEDFFVLDLLISVLIFHRSANPYHRAFLASFCLHVLPDMEFPLVHPSLPFELCRQNFGEAKTKIKQMLELAYRPCTLKSL